MKKKMLFVIATIAAFVLFVPNTLAAEAKIGTDEYDTLKEAINAADNETVVLTSDVTVNETLLIENKVVTLDLAGYDITFAKGGDCIKVIGGTLTVTGTGTIEEKEPYYAPIMVFGSDDSSKINYTVVTVGKDVTLNGWAGVFVKQTSNNNAYGVNVTINGTINSLKDTDGAEGAGVYVNGNIQPKNGESVANFPIITLGETAVINSEGDGIYAAGYATWNINGAIITGVTSGLGIKAGEFNITDATITATGEFAEGTKNNNGINGTGAAIQVESNPSYAGLVTLNIDGGTYSSFNGYALYEYNVDETANAETTVSSIEITDGDFMSAEGKSAIVVTEKLVEENPGFVTGGTFTGADVNEYVSDDYVTIILIGMLEGEETYTESVVVEKDSYLPKDEMNALKDELNKELAVEGYKFDGFFADKELTKEFDFEAALTTDTTIYMGISEVVEELPPKTSDLNLVLLIGTIMLGVVGTILVSKKRFAKSN